AASGCRYGGDALNASTQAKIQHAIDQAMIESEPLCVAAGPFPFRGGTRAHCDKCQALADAGLLERRVGDVVEFTLTSAGKDAYREDADPEFVALVRERFAQQHRAEAVDEKALRKPRLCFGKTRFH